MHFSTTEQNPSRSQRSTGPPQQILASVLCTPGDSGVPLSCAKIRRHAGGLSRSFFLGQATNKLLASWYCRPEHIGGETRSKGAGRYAVRNADTLVVTAFDALRLSKYAINNGHGTGWHDGKDKPFDGTLSEATTAQKSLDRHRCACTPVSFERSKSMFSARAHVFAGYRLAASLNRAHYLPLHLVVAVLCEAPGAKSE